MSRVRTGPRHPSRREEPDTRGLLALPCACANIRRLSRLVTRLYDAELRESGLEVTQFGVLSALHHLGEMSHGQLAAGFGMDGTTLTRTVSVLERRGLLTRRAGADRRQRVYSISPDGRAQLAAARAGWQRAQNRVRAVVGEEALDAVMTAATTLFGVRS